MTRAGIATFEPGETPQTAKNRTRVAVASDLGHASSKCLRFWYARAMLRRTMNRIGASATR